MWRGIFGSREDYEKRLQYLSKEEAAVHARMRRRTQFSPAPSVTSSSSPSSPRSPNPLTIPLFVPSPIYYVCGCHI
uniref:Uncharacterized protein n=1 Tax=Hordeum vulgare subsp. vulgare TaxID=112509 RepID=A0A8I6YBE9_HORVV